MAYFIYKFKVQVLICSVILMASYSKRQVNAEENVIRDFLQTFIKPFLRSANFGPAPAINVMASDVPDTNIIKFIKRKVAELKALVQDDDGEKRIETEDKLTLQGNGETTLIEFLPKPMRKNEDEFIESIKRKPIKADPLKTSINKYKAIKEQIKMMLDKEKVTEGTRSLILSTLDEIIAKLIESQCKWIPDRKTMFGNMTDNSISKLNSMTKKQWKKLRHQYMDYLTSRKDKENAFMNEFNEFFSGVINDTQNLSDRYKIRCQLVAIDNDKKETTKTLLREDEQVEQSKCENFILCSKELREFFIDFYKYVNDTATSVFKNYASMYTRDVNVDFGVDKSIVVAILNNISHIAERKVIKIYKNEIKMFKLDPIKDKSANIKIFQDFINRVIMMTKTNLKEHIVQELQAKKTKLFTIIKEDLSVNLELDMDNLETHYLEVLCTYFEFCNGRYSTRKHGEPWTFRPRSNDEVFVKVQLSLDDEMKGMVKQSGILDYFKNPSHAKYRLDRNNRRTNDYFSISVTRTSVRLLNTTETRFTNLRKVGNIVKNETQLMSNHITNKTISRAIA